MTRAARALLVAVFAALLSASVSLVAPAARADGPSRAGLLVVWHAYRGAEQKALDAIVASFRAARPGVVVETLAVPFDAYASKLEAAIPHGHGPDVFLDAHERLGDFRERGLVAEASFGDWSAFEPAAVDAVTLDGKRYGVPLALKCLALYLRGPTWADRTPASLDDLIRIGRELHPKRPPPQQPNRLVVLGYEAAGAYGHAPILHAFGGQILDASDRYAFADGPAVDSIGWVARALEDGAIPEEPSGALVTQLFRQGSELAGTDAAISGPWLAAELPEQLSYRVVPIPPVRAGGEPSRPYLTVEAAMVAPKPRDPALARAFVDHLVAKEQAIVRAKVGRQIVATKAAWGDPALEADDFLRGFAEASRLAIAMPTSKAMRAAWEPTSRAIQKVLRGDLDARAAIDEAARRYADVTRPLPKERDPVWALLLVGAIGVGVGARSFRVARESSFRAELRASLPAYAYVAHAVIVVALLVVVPLVIGAATSLFAGRSGSLHYVGLANYWDILTARGGPLLATGSFYAVLLVTVLWTVCNLALHLAIGVALALLLARPALRLRGVYRVLLIVPWAVPSYVSALAWKGMFHRQLGAVNAVLEVFGVEPIAWFSRFATAFAANVATNVWLGFPFMMVVTLGALASIPREVLEAAEVDGATRWQRFRLVTLPLLKPTMMPSVVLGAVWTFNMFNVVFLVSGGEPDGRTEILVSEAYRWAFTRQAQYGYASAYAVLIFFLLLFTTRVLRPRTAA